MQPIFQPADAPGQAGKLRVAATHATLDQRQATKGDTAPDKTKFDKLVHKPAAARSIQMKSVKDRTAKAQGVEVDARLPAQLAEEQLRRIRGRKPILQRIDWPMSAVKFLVGFGAAMFVFFNPVTSFLISLTMLVGGGAIYYFLGYDVFWRKLLRPLRWYVARHPERAGELHARIDRFAMRWDAVLDKLPEGAVAALYLPDVSDLAEAARKDEAQFDLRLKKLGQAGMASG